MFSLNPVVLAGWPQLQKGGPQPLTPIPLGCSGNVACALSSPLASFLMWLPGGHFQESLAFATATAFCVAATHELSSSKSTVSGCLQSFSVAFKGDKWQGIPSNHPCTPRKLICSLKMEDTLLPKPLLHNALGVSEWHLLCPESHSPQGNSSFLFSLQPRLKIHLQQCKNT